MSPHTESKSVSPLSLEEKEYRKKLAAFLLYVRQPELLAGRTVEIFQRHPSGLGGETLRIPKDWWNYLSKTHPSSNSYRFMD